MFPATSIKLDTSFIDKNSPNQRSMYQNEIYTIRKSFEFHTNAFIVTSFGEGTINSQSMV